MQLAPLALLLGVGLLEVSLYASLLVERGVDLLDLVRVADAPEVELGRHHYQLLLYLRPLRLLPRHRILDDRQLGEGVVLRLQHL